MKKQSGRTHKTTGVSLPPDLKEQVEARTRRLYPKVSSFSNYVVQLILLDFKKGLVGPAEKNYDPTTCSTFGYEFALT